MKRKFVIAVDSFKGCLTSAEAGGAVAEALRTAVADAETACVEVSDGGEGMASAFTKALGGSIEKAYVHDLMMRCRWAKYGVTADGTA